MSTFASTISIGSLHYFSYDGLNTTEPHYFLCVAKEEGRICFMLVVTSQVERQMEYFESRALPFESLVPVNPSTENQLTKESCINCRRVHEVPESKLNELNATGGIRPKGRLEENYFQQVVTGMLMSPLIERDLKQRISDHAPT